MKVLFVGDLSSYARAKQRFEVMQELGYLVKGLSSVTPETERSQNNRPSIWSRIRHKIGYPLDSVNINEKLIPALTNFQPDVLWIEKTNTVFLSTYKKIRQAFPQIKIVYYSEDDIYMPHNRSAYLTRSLPIFDAVFTTKPRNVKELPKLGVRRVVCVFKAYNQSFHRPIVLSTEEQTIWGADVSFVGTFEEDRYEKMLFLAAHGIKVRVWGKGWQKYQNKHPNLLVEAKLVLNEDFIKVINATLINLNFLRKINRDRHTARSVEIPACQGFMLTERTDEHSQLFEEGKETEFFDSQEELLSKVQYYLENDKNRLDIAKAGRQRCLDSGYSHHARLQFIFGKIFP